MATRKSKKTGPEHVHDVLGDFDTLMVGTYEATGEQPRLRARPMAVAKLDEDCTLYFLSRIDTAKVDEALSPTHGTVVGQRRNRYLAAMGRFEVLKDTRKIAALWKASFGIWFEGPDDPSLVLLVFHPEQVEIWDSKGLKGVKYAFEVARALVTGQRPDRDEDPEQHERVELH